MGGKERLTLEAGLAELCIITDESLANVIHL